MLALPPADPTYFLDCSTFLTFFPTTPPISFLVAQQVLEIRRGKGTFVVENLPDSVMDLTALSNLRSRVRARIHMSLA